MSESAYTPSSPSSSPSRGQHVLSSSARRASRCLTWATMVSASARKELDERPELVGIALVWGGRQEEHVSGVMAKLFREPVDLDDGEAFLDGPFHQLFRTSARDFLPQDPLEACLATLHGEDCPEDVQLRHRLVVRIL